MVHLDVQIETTHRGLDIEMLGPGHVSPGNPISLADGSTITWSSAPLRKYLADPYLFNLVVSLASGDTAGALSAWLYDKLKGQRATLRINRAEVEIEPGRIRCVIAQIAKDGDMSCEGLAEREGMDELSITFGIGVDLGGKSVRSAPFNVTAEITRAKSYNKKLTGRMLYLVPRQLREIKDSKDVIVTFEGTTYRFVRLDADGSFELRRDA